MATIGYATLQIIPSLKGVTEAIDRQVEGKVVNVTIEPKVDQRATEQAGQQAKQTVEKHTKEVKVEPKVDQKAAESAGKQAGESVARGVSGSSSAVGEAVTGIIEGAGAEAGRRLGEKLRDMIPTGMTGAAERIGAALRNNLPAAGEIAGTILGSAIGVALTDAIGKERLDKAGRAVISGLTKAVNTANNVTDIGVSIGEKVAGGLTVASGTIGNAATGILDTIGGITTGIDATRQLLGGDDSWAAPGLDALNGALGTVTPLLESVNGAAMLASAGAQAISTAAGIATKAQLLWNAALIANPIGLIVAAIAAVVAGLVLFFTKTELGRKIWEGFTEYLKIAWEAIKTAFGAAWDVISGIFTGMVEGAQRVWDGIKERFTAVVEFVKGIPGAISSAARGMWDGLKSGLVAVLNWIGDKWNSFAGSLSIDLPGELFDVTLPRMPRFSKGGYTGGGSTDKIAGVVHGGEYVIKASSTAGIENAMPGLLDYLNNNGPLPGFKGGGKVALGNISTPGITSGEQQSMWDAVRGKFPDAVLSSATRTVMTEGRPDFHNAGRAIDITGPNMGAIASWIASTFPDSLELIHSPFGRNIKNGKNVGDGTGFYGANTMAGHRDHVHWALGKTAKVRQPESVESEANANAAPSASDMISTLGVGDGATASVPQSAGQSSSMSMPGSLSGLAGIGLSGLGDGVGETTSGSDLGLLGDAAASAVSGQVSSVLGAFGVNDAPGWLTGLSKFVGGISVSEKGGGGVMGGDGPNPVAPLVSAASSAVGQTAASALGSIHGAQAGQAPGPQVVYNVRTATVEDAFLVAQRREKERAAANLARF